MGNESTELLKALLQALEFPEQNLFFLGYSDFQHTFSVIQEECPSAKFLSLGNFYDLSHKPKSREEKFVLCMNILRKDRIETQKIIDDSEYSENSNYYDPLKIKYTQTVSTRDIQAITKCLDIHSKFVVDLDFQSL